MKIYDRLDVSILAAIVDEATKVGLPVAGHAPFAVPIETTLSSGVRSLEHGQLYPFAYLSDGVQLPEGPFQPQTHYPPEIASLDAPTLKSWGPENFRFQMFQDRQLLALRALGRAALMPFVADLDRAGGKLLVGSDAPEAFVVPGSGLHDELRYLVEAGLTPARVLKAATVDAASYLGRDDWGRVQPGAEADFILLSDNPLEDIAATRSIEGVVNDGHWMPSR